MRNLAILALLASALRGEEEEPPPQPPPTLSQAVEELAKALADKAIDDVLTALPRVAGAYPGAAPDVRRASVAAVAQALKVDDLRVRHGAMAALGTMRAKGSSKHLTKWLDPPNDLKAEDPITYVEAIKAVGEIADPATLATLDKLSDHRELPIAVAGTVALGGYEDLPVGARKKLAFDLVSRLNMLTSSSRRADWGESAILRRTQLGVATVTALQRLTGKKFETPDGWNRWKEEAERQRNPFE
ncbi:MAG: hypothetical protein ACT4PV_03790 [Planctomycetaceae bacterium]